MTDFDNAVAIAKARAESFELEKIKKDKTMEKLRDQFAMAALTGILTNCLAANDLVIQANVEHAYEYADTALETRKIK